MDFTTINLNQPSKVTLQDLTLFLDGTPLEGLAGHFIAAEQKYNIHAIYLLAHAIHESDFGKSKIAREKNNLFGFGAYDRNPYDNAVTFKSYAHCIDYCAGYIKQHYLTPGGKYYNGPTLRGMNVKYATDKKWADKIANWMKLIYKQIGSYVDYKGHWAEYDIYQALELGFLAGHSDGTIRPDEECTRAEAVVMVMRVYRKLQDEINGLKGVKK